MHVQFLVMKVTLSLVLFRPGTQKQRVSQGKGILYQVACWYYGMWSMEEYLYRFWFREKVKLYCFKHKWEVETSTNILGLICCLSSTVLQALIVWRRSCCNRHPTRYQEAAIDHMHNILANAAAGSLTVGVATILQQTKFELDFALTIDWLHDMNTTLWTIWISWNPEYTMEILDRNVTLVEPLILGMGGLALEPLLVRGYMMNLAAQSISIVLQRWGWMPLSLRLERQTGRRESRHAEWEVGTMLTHGASFCCSCNRWWSRLEHSEIWTCDLDLS